MKFTLSWLKEHLDTTASVDEIAETLTRIGLEVEEVINPAAKLAGFASRNDETGFTKFDGMECVECGSCSYVCPAKRPLTQQIKAMRRTIMANRRKK